MEGVDTRKQVLTRRMIALENHVQTLEKTCSEVCNSIDARMTEQHKQWLVELESGGNVKFIPGDPSIPWYKSCVELVGSRFSVADVQVCMSVCLSVTYTKVWCQDLLCVYVCLCVCL